MTDLKHKWTAEDHEKVNLLISEATEGVKDFIMVAERILEDLDVEKETRRALISQHLFEKAMAAARNLTTFMEEVGS